MPVSFQWTARIAFLQEKFPNASEDTARQNVVSEANTMRQCGKYTKPRNKQKRI